MAPITTTCAGCGRAHTIPDRYLGRELKCPGCGHPLRLDAPSPASIAAEDAPGTVFPEAPPAPPRPTLPAAPAQTVTAADEGVPTADEGIATAAVFWRVRRLGILSTAAVSAVLHGLLGVLAGIAIAVVSLAGLRKPVPFPLGPLAGVAALIVVPLIYAVIGFVLGAVLAAGYNLTARLTGGVKVLLE